MTTAEAAREWVDAKRAIDEATPRKEAAAKVLKEHFRTSKRQFYRSTATGDTITYSTQVRTVLDQKAVKVELGDRIGEFQRSQTVESLALLK